jgi:hypothetical protein
MIKIHIFIFIYDINTYTGTNQNHCGDDDGESHFDDIFQDEPTSFATPESSLPSKEYRSQVYIHICIYMYIHL